MSTCPTFLRSAVSSSSISAPRRVLYVEDHPINAMLMQSLLETHASVDLSIEPTGAAGLRNALARTPDLLLLDLGLPDCHGVQLLKQMRAHPQLAQVPAVAVTAEDLRTFDGSSFAEVWLKPLDLVRTLQRLNCLLGLSTPDSGDPAEVGRSPRSEGGVMFKASFLGVSAMLAV